MKLLWALGYLWCLPLTAAGLVQALVGGARYAGRAGSVLLFHAGAAGLVRRFFEKSSVVAYTWGAVITLRREVDARDQRLLRHELAHVRQCLLLGPFAPAIYLGCSAWAWSRGGHWYRDNAMEAWARRAEVG